MSVAVPLDVVLFVVLEHVPDVVRVAKQIVPLRAERYPHHVATLARGFIRIANGCRWNRGRLPTSGSPLVPGTSLSGWGFGAVGCKILSWNSFVRED